MNGTIELSLPKNDEKQLEADSQNGDVLSIEERIAIVKSLSGIAAVGGKTPPTDEESEEDYTNYLVQKYK